MNREPIKSLTHTGILWGSILIGILGLVVPFIIDMPTLSLQGLYFTLPLVFFPISYIYLKQNPVSNSLPKQIPIKLFLALFFGLWALATFLLLEGVRPLGYFLTISILIGILVAEVFYCNRTYVKKFFLPLQASLLFLNLVYGVVLKYHLYVAGTDPIVHISYIQNLLETGSVTESLGIYSSFPLYHILVAIQSRLAGGAYPATELSYIIVGVVGVSGLVFVYSSL